MEPTLPVEIMIILGAAAAVVGLSVVFWEQLFRPAPAGAEEEPRVVIRPEETPSTRTLNVIGRLAEPESHRAQDALRQSLLQAGWRFSGARAAYLASRVGLSLLLPWPLFLFVRPESISGTLFVILLGAAAGYYLPLAVMLTQRRRRQLLLLRPFPNALDMLVSSLEGGLGLDAALKQVAGELALTAPELAEELEMVISESRLGLPRAEVFRHFSERTGLEEVASLVNVLSHAERYGVSISSSIRTHAQLVRRRRALLAEKRAAQAVPKLTVVMILFILPTLFIVVLGPTAINIALHLMPVLESAGR